MNRRSPLAVLLVVALVGCSSVEQQQAPPSGTPTSSTAPTSTAAASTLPTSITPTPIATPTPTPTPTTTHREPSSVPAISAKAWAAGLRDVRTVVPDARIDLRYATPDNFTHVRLYPRDARCLVHTSMTAGLAAAGRAARRARLQLVFWDCYRPHAVQVRMFEIVPNPTFVARPGPYARSHEAGRSVDVTLARDGELLDMGTGFDDFSARAAAYATRGVTAHAERDRALLRKLMQTGGFEVYAGEWWHFDGRGAATDRPHLNAPVR